MQQTKRPLQPVVSKAEPPPLSPLSPESHSSAATAGYPSPKSIRAISKVNRANAQSRLSGILFALANGKLYFECLKIFSVPENHLPFQGVKTLPKSAFSVKEKTPCYSVKKTPCHSVLKK